MIHHRIRYEKHCPIHGKVDAAEIVKGSPYAPDQYVVIEDAELERLRPPKEKALLLEQFVEVGQVEPVMPTGIGTNACGTSRSYPSAAGGPCLSDPS